MHPVCTFSDTGPKTEAEKERSPTVLGKTAGPLASYQPKLDSTHDKILREPWPGATRSMIEVPDSAFAPLTDRSKPLHCFDHEEYQYRVKVQAFSPRHLK